MRLNLWIAGLVRSCMCLLVMACFISVASVAMAADKTPILLGIDAEFGVPTSTSAQAVRLGMKIAVDEINQRGGLLGGRKLMIEERDNRSVPARSIQNLRELAALPDLVAVFCGKYSPVVVEALPVIHELKMPLLDPWAAADPITDHAFRPSYTFRLSLKDSWAMEAMLTSAAKRGFRRVGFLAPNTEWGRSSLRAAERYLGHNKGAVRLVGVHWYNWGDESLLNHYRSLREAGAQTLILVANEREGAILVNELASLPASERMPIISHWGVTGGRFYQNAAKALEQIDFSVVQTYTFNGTRSPRAQAVLAAARQIEGISGPRDLPSPVGVVHAYDLTHILARAIEHAGSTDRAAIRDALEQVKNYEGLIKRYPQPFTASRHDALDATQVFMARFASDGAIEAASFK